MKIMEFLREKTIRIFDTTKFVPEGFYQFKVTMQSGPNPRCVIFNAIVIDVDKDHIDILVYINKDTNPIIYEKLNKIFREISNNGLGVYHYQIYTSMLDGTYRDRVGPLQMEINRLVPEESDD